MLFDNNNDNLLSTFGKDSQSSNRKNSGVKQGVKNKRTCLNYFNDVKMQQKNKYEQILNERKTLMLMQKKSQINNNNYINNKITNNNKFNNNMASQLLRQKQESKKKLKTESDIEYLNNKIRKSISGIAQTICKSKIHLESNKKLHQQKHQRQSTSNLHRQKQLLRPNQFFTTTNTRQFSSSSHNNKLLNDRLKSSRYQNQYNQYNNNSDKQNISGLVNKNNTKYDVNNNTKYDVNNNNRFECNKDNNNKKNILRNSTKKKARFFSTTTTTNDINHFNNSNDIIKGIKVNSINNNHNHSRQQSNSSRLYTQPMSTTLSTNNWCSRFDTLNNNNNNSNRKQRNQQQKQYRMSLQSQRQQQHYSQSSLNRFNKLKSQLNKQSNSKCNNNNNNNNNNRIQDTLKKQSKQLLMLVESNYIELPKLVDSSKNDNNIISNSNRNNNNNSNRNSNNNSNRNNNNHYSNNTNNNNSKKFTTRSTAMNSCNNNNNTTSDNRDSDRNHYYCNKNNNDNRNFIHNRQPTLQSQHLLSQTSQYQYQQYQQQQQQHQHQKSPNFNNIQVPTKIFSLYDIKKNIQLYTEDTKRKHPLILALMQQIELDYDLRHAKHMFSGIEQPFVITNRNMMIDREGKYILKGQSYRQSPLTTTTKSKWQLLNKQLTSRGLNYNVETIKKHFLPTEQQLDPFLSVTQSHDELIHSLIYAYETAQIHWQQTIYKKWQHWDLRDIQLTIENIDRDRKGYITVEDVAAFVSMQSGNEYKNRDVILMYKRLLCMGGGNQQSNNNTCNTNSSSSKSRLKFRSLIDCLIKGF